jgi:tetraacyldisaccharide 4'-kinase
MLFVARRLEQGRFDGTVARWIARAWGPIFARGLVRSLPAPGDARVVAIGGATLGGSGKTPLAIACARELARQGARVAFIGHAYRARPRRARVVGPDDSLADVGDEALLAARALASHRVPVVVAPSRALAMAWAARKADVLVLDGVLQTAPARASLSLLAVDAEEPWGHASAVPPRGDLRAPIGAMLAVVDRVVPIGEEAAGARVVSRGAYHGDTLLSWEALRSLRLGLACALARPDRLIRALARRGITPCAVVRSGDHAPIPTCALRAQQALASHGSGVDLWLATAKCALHVVPERTRMHTSMHRPIHSPIAMIEYEVECSPALSACLSAARLDPRTSSAIVSKDTSHWGGIQRPDLTVTRPRE